MPAEVALVVFDDLQLAVLVAQDRDRVVDAASGTFGVRLELPNPGYRLPAGLKCKVRFPR